MAAASDASNGVPVPVMAQEVLWDAFDEHIPVFVPEVPPPGVHGQAWAPAAVPAGATRAVTRRARAPKKGSSQGTTNNVDEASDISTRQFVGIERPDTVRPGGLNDFIQRLATEAGITSDSTTEPDRNRIAAHYVGSSVIIGTGVVLSAVLIAMASIRVLVV